MGDYLFLLSRLEQRFILLLSRNEGLLKCIGICRAS